MVTMIYTKVNTGSHVAEPIEKPVVINHSPCGDTVSLHGILVVTRSIAKAKKIWKRGPDRCVHFQQSKHVKIQFNSVTKTIRLIEKRENPLLTDLSN